MHRSLRTLASAKFAGPALAALLCGAGCAHTKAPQAELTASHGAIRAAEELHATDVPKANLHLQMAKENVERAEKLMNAGQNEEACFLLLRAKSDAELSLALAKEASVQQEAQKALDKAQQLTPAPKS